MGIFFGNRHFRLCIWDTRQYKKFKLWASIPHHSQSSCCKLKKSDTAVIEIWVQRDIHTITLFYFFFIMEKKHKESHFTYKLEWVGLTNLFKYMCMHAIHYNSWDPPTNTKTKNNQLWQYKCYKMFQHVH